MGRHSLVAADLDRGLSIESSGKDGDSGPEQLLWLVEQAVAPANSGFRISTARSNTSGRNRS
jgi:hypothetical protein